MGKARNLVGQNVGVFRPAHYGIGREHRKGGQETEGE